MTRVGPLLASMLLVAAACGGRALDFDDPVGVDGGVTRPGDGGAVRRDGGGTTVTKDGGVIGKDAGRPKPPPPPPDECEPGDMSSFIPTWKPPAPLHSGKCSAAQAEALMCLFDAAADQSTCDALVNDPANDGCFQCIYTSSSGPKLGPVIITANFGSLNTAGCIAGVTGNTTATGCGAKLQASEQCADEACAGCAIDGFDENSIYEYQACTEQAATTVCSEFTDDAACAEALLDTDGGASVCGSGNDFLERAIVLAKLFCGP